MLSHQVLAIEARVLSVDLRLITTPRNARRYSPVIYHPRRPSRAFLKRAGHAGKIFTVIMMLALISVPWMMFG
jgi:hypothetical protein